MARENGSAHRHGDAALSEPQALRVGIRRGRALGGAAPFSISAALPVQRGLDAGLDFKDGCEGLAEEVGDAGENGLWVGHISSRPALCLSV